MAGRAERWGLVILAPLVPCGVACEILAGIEDRSLSVPSSAQTTGAAGGDGAGAGGGGGGDQGGGGDGSGASGEGGAGAGGAGAGGAGAGGGGAGAGGAGGDGGGGGAGGGCDGSGGGVGCDGLGDPYSSVVRADAPLGYWRLDETMGPEIFDSSCTGEYDAAVKPGGGDLPLGFEYEGVVSGNDAIRFVGADHDHVNLGAYFNFSEGESFSLEAWVKPEVIDGTKRRVFEKLGYAPEQQGYFLSVATGGVQFDRWVAGTRQGVTSIQSLTLDAWVHLVGTYDACAGVTCLYINAEGTCTPTNLPGTTAVSDDLRIGATSGGSTGLKGVYDELAIYGYALTHAQVHEHCTAADNASVQCDPRPPDFP